jgi:hypothetical protein
LRKRRAASVSGVGQEGERERTTDEVSKSFLMTSKPRRSGGFGMSLGDTCLLPRWCPACRWRELGPGFGAERGNLSPRYRATVHLADGGHPVVERENPKWQKPQGAEYRLRGAGADRLVVAMMPGNAGGAKGTACPGSFGGQP